MTRPRILFYVQHLLGVGHVHRAVRIARGLSSVGFAVDLVLGGEPGTGVETGGLNVIQLLPLKAGPQGFSELVTMNGEPADAGLKARRTAQLLEAFDRSRPDIVLIEAFPFGRRQMRFELLPLIERAHALLPRPLIVSSVRDILQESANPARARETVELLQRLFDQVVVHGDPSLIALDASFPLAREIAPITVYSGIVAPPPPSAARVKGAEVDVVVSAGGGAVGRALLEAAMAAKSASPLAAARWLVLTGPGASAADFDALAATGKARAITVERFVPDLAAVLAGARLSISQAGYNTVADVLVARCKALLVPFARSGETEQTRRAELLQKKGIAVMLPEKEMESEALAEAIARALALPASGASVDVDGAVRTAAILSGLLGPRGERSPTPAVPKA